jgi:hypothetical protein
VVVGRRLADLVARAGEGHREGFYCFFCHSLQ